MQKITTDHSASSRQAEWVPLTFSTLFLFRHVRILGWSLVLVLITGFLTWIGYLLTVDLVDGLTGHFFQQAPAAAGIQGWFIVMGWQALKILFLIVSRVIAFYLAFLIAYCLTSPGYVFLSAAVEKAYAGKDFQADEGLTVSGALIDLMEGCKIGAVGVGVTIAALLANFIPIIGQALVFLLYTFYSALMFVDYPASRRRWSLGRKIRWVRVHRKRSFRLGLLPALISLVPVINIFFMALLFPLFTVHATLNFINGQE